MGIKAPDTLVLIIEKQHASWSLMATATPALDLRFGFGPAPHPALASARPSADPLCPHARMVVNAVSYTHLTLPTILLV